MASTIRNNKPCTQGQQQLRIALIPFAVVGDKWRDEPWWTSGATVRLLLSEYVKYVAAEMRVRLADLGLDLMPDLAEQPAGSLPPHKPATALAN